MATEDDATPELEPSDLLDSEERIDDDMPCIQCSYNLRGLNYDGRCPECGAPVESTVEFLMQRVLCLACLAPNHPSAALCSNCNSPISAAAATADYWRPHAVSGGGRRKRKSDEDQEPEPPSAGWPVLCGFIAAAALVKIAACVVDVWNLQPGSLDSPQLIRGDRIIAILAALLVALFPLAIIYFPTRHYLRARRDYFRRHRGFMERQLAAEAQEYPGDTPDTQEP